MISTGRVRQGEKWVEFAAPIIEPEEKIIPVTKPKKKCRCKWEERCFLLECIDLGLISREDYEYLIKHPKKGGG
ncbi:hypothetical protein ABEV74_07315 [Paenibacillus cisolokensis]|uniref:hypothetical protein n=1 Tax=Paenibacillus cisolokensis TaxID=1658519 RepID=UPI003D27EFD2